jgi:hypothetical protein
VLRDEWEEYVRLRQQDMEENMRLRQREKREMEETLRRLTDRFVAKSTADLGKPDSKLTKRLGETGKLVQKITSLQEDTYQVSSVHSEIEKVNEKMKESLNVSLK